MTISTVSYRVHVKIKHSSSELRISLSIEIFIWNSIKVLATTKFIASRRLNVSDIYYASPSASFYPPTSIKNGYPQSEQVNEEEAVKFEFVCSLRRDSC